jgi:capsular exopolysaccharide synthesis family protein
VLLLTPLIAGGIAYLVVQRMPSVYQASETVAVQTTTAAGGIGDIQAAQALADSYAEQLRARPVLSEAAALIGLNGVSPEQLDGIVQTRRVSNTPLVTVLAASVDPATAERLVSSVVQVFIDQTAQAATQASKDTQNSLLGLIAQLQTQLDTTNQQLGDLRAQPESPDGDAQINTLQARLTRLQAYQDVAMRSLEDFQLAQARGAGAITVVDPAAASSAPIRPNRSLVVLMSALAGLFAGLGLAWLGERSDQELRDARQVQAALELPTLSVVPNAKSGVSPLEPIDPEVLTSFRELRANLLVGLRNQSTQLVAISSARDGEGKSVVAANLSVSLAHTGRKVILVDADLYEPVQASFFRVQGGPGLSQLLMNHSEEGLDSTVASPSANLRLLAAGALQPPNADPSALLSSTRLTSVLDELRGASDVVIVDTPSVLAHPESALLSALADSVIVVVDSRRSRKDDSQAAVDVLRTAGARVIGVVLNRTRRPRIPGLYAAPSRVPAAEAPPAVDLVSTVAVSPMADD